VDTNEDNNYIDIDANDFNRDYKNDNKDYNDDFLDLANTNKSIKNKNDGQSANRSRTTKSISNINNLKDNNKNIGNNIDMSKKAILVREARLKTLNKQQLIKLCQLIKIQQFLPDKRDMILTLTQLPNDYPDAITYDTFMYAYTNSDKESDNNNNHNTVTLTDHAYDMHDNKSDHKQDHQVMGAEYDSKYYSDTSNNTKKSCREIRKRKNKVVTHKEVAATAKKNKIATPIQIHTGQQRSMNNKKVTFNFREDDCTMFDMGDNTIENFTNNNKYNNKDDDEQYEQ
jgi:hypothetical protein